MNVSFFELAEDRIIHWYINVDPTDVMFVEQQLRVSIEWQ